jgi:uncharacterized membrane protein
MLSGDSRSAFLFLLQYEIIGFRIYVFLAVCLL